MKIHLLKTRSSNSCNFCRKGELTENGMGLKYPYENVVGFSNENGGGLYACICRECLTELYEKAAPLLNSQQGVKVSDTTKAQ